MKMKNRSHKYDINRPRSRHGHKYNKYKKYFTMMILYVLCNTLATCEAQFMKKLSNTEAELKKALVIKKTCISPLNRQKHLLVAPPDNLNERIFFHA